MLAVIGFFVGEAVEGSSFLFDAQITGPAITHFTQVPDGWDALIVTMIGAAEAQRDAAIDDPGSEDVHEVGAIATILQLLKHRHHRIAHLHHIHSSGITRLPRPLRSICSQTLVCVAICKSCNLRVQTFFNFIGAANWMIVAVSPLRVR